MPKSRFQISITHWEEIHALPDSWPEAKLREVLVLADYDEDVSADELSDIVLMLLQDMKPRLASELVLQAVFGAKMSAGVRQNIAEDLEDDRPWEEYPMVHQQAGLFEAVVLLQRAFPTRFGTPDALRLTIQVKAREAEGSLWLKDEPCPGLLMRLLACGMEEDAVVNRLYEEELNGRQFADAKGMLWAISLVGSSQEGTLVQKDYDIISSLHWLEPLAGHDTWEAKGWPDAAPSR